MLNIIEIFASVQGETSFTGLPTTFIRLASCNLRCSWCDTTYSFGRGEPHSLEMLLEKVKENGCPYVCITGGEPLLQEKVYLLMQNFCDEGFSVSLETGGSLCTSKVDPRVVTILDIKCPGSLMEKKNYWANLEQLKPLDEVKFVIKDHTDYEYAKDVCQRFGLYNRSNPPLFSPVFEALDPKMLVGWILHDKLPVRLNLQTHKYIWSKDTRGV